MVVTTYLYIDMVFAFYGYIDLFGVCFTHSSLLSWMLEIVWTHAALGVLYACVLYFGICTYSAQLSMFHMERRSRNTIIIVIIITLFCSLGASLAEVEGFNQNQGLGSLLLDTLASQSTHNHSTGHVVTPTTAASQQVWIGTVQYTSIQIQYFLI